MLKSNLRWMWLTVFIISLTSCQDPAYKAKQAVRNAYIDRNAMLYLSREQAGPEHLEALAELDQEMRRRYADRLEKTIKLVNERWQYDNNRWIEMRPVREQHIRRMLEGKPEDIPDVWRKMTY